jgi:DNA-binding CsgD family transcriptional regulator
MTRHIPIPELDQALANQIITPAEHDVLALRHRGLSQWQIALALDLSRWAVRDRERNGIRKIDVHRRKDAAA